MISGMGTAFRQFHSLADPREGADVRPPPPPPLEPLCISKQFVCFAELLINKVVYQENG